MDEDVPTVEEIVENPPDNVEVAEEVADAWRQPIHELTTQIAQLSGRVEELHALQNPPMPAEPEPLTVPLESDPLPDLTVAPDPTPNPSPDADDADGPASQTAAARSRRRRLTLRKRP